MKFRPKAMVKRVLQRLGDKYTTPGLKESLEKRDSKARVVVMGRAQRAIYAGRHIQFGNNISEDGGNKTRRTWKPNSQAKRLYSYIHGDLIRLKVTTHAIRCIDKAGGIDEYLLKTPYHKLDSEIGLYWKAKIEKMYKDRGGKELVFISPDDEAKFEKSFKNLKLANRAAARIQMHDSSGDKQIEGEDSQEADEGHADGPQQVVANS